MIAMSLLPFWLMTSGVEPLLAGSATAGSEVYRDQKRLSTFVVPADHCIDAIVAGRSVRLKIDGDTGARRIVNASLAKSLSLKGSGIQGAVRFGPVEMIARSQSVSTSINGLKSGKLRWHWFERDVVIGADGFISPTVMPYATVLFRFRPNDPDDLTQSLPLTGPGMFGFSGGEAELSIGDQSVAVGAAFDRPDTIVSASAGALLAQTNGGRFEGQISLREVRYGVQRPVRLMRFSTPVRVASLNITAVYVRLAEEGASGLPSDDVKQKPQIDDNEIVVNGKHSGRRPRLVISLGTDNLAKCATVAYENQANRLTFSCKT